MPEISQSKMLKTRTSVHSGLQISSRFVNLVTSTDDLDAIFSETIAGLKTLFLTEHVALYTFAIKNQKLDFKYHKNGKTGLLKKVGVDTLMEDMSLVLATQSSSKTIVTQSNNTNAAFTNDPEKMTYKIAFPFYYHNHILGCLRIDCPLSQVLLSEIESIGFLITAHLKNLCGKAIEQYHHNEFKSRIRKLINAKVNELEIALDKADKYNQSLKDFSYIVSHDLREPLRTINSYIKLIERRYSKQLDSDASEFMFFVSDGVERMDALIKDLLLFSRIENSEYQFEPVDIGDILLKIQNSLFLKISETESQLIFNKLPTLVGSKSHLLIIFQNLIENAIKFQHEARTPIIQIDFEELKEHWHFSIKDNGIGMDLDHKNNERIFKVFQRLQSFDSDIAGTGIGLALCKNIVLNHNGKIWVQSTIHEGSTFHFTISKKLNRS